MKIRTLAYKMLKVLYDYGILQVFSIFYLQWSSETSYREPIIYLQDSSGQTPMTATGHE